MQARDHVIFTNVALVSQFAWVTVKKKNTIDWVPCNQQKFIFHYSGDWEVQNQGTSTFSGWWNPAQPEGASPATFVETFLVHSRLPFLRASHARKEERFLWDLFYKGTNPSHEDSTLVTQSLHKGPAFSCSHIKIWGTHLAVGSTWLIQWLPHSGLYVGWMDQIHRWIWMKSFWSFNSILSPFVCDSLSLWYHCLHHPIPQFYL